MDRRTFLTILSGAVAAAGSPDAWRWAARAADEPRAAEPVGGGAGAYVFFAPAEIVFVRAAVARLIPADELGPGAVEAGVPYFIDQQLAGASGAAAHFYNQGPFGAQTPYQGYQLPLSPAELYRVGIAATDQYCRQQHGKVFADLEPAVQDEILAGLQGIAGDVDLKEVPGATFFARLLADTMDGFFADPAYGGNRHMVGWKLVGFPGVAANYAEAIGRHNEPYRVEPVDMHGLQEANLPAVHHGHAVHRQADASSIRLTTAPEAAEAANEPRHPWTARQRIFV